MFARGTGKDHWEDVMKNQRLIFKSGTSCKTWSVKAVEKATVWTFLRSEAGVVVPVWPFLIMLGDEGEVLVFAWCLPAPMATKSEQNYQFDDKKDANIYHLESTM